MMNRTYEGIVTSFDRGYGFILDEYGEQQYVFHKDILMEGYRRLTPGQRVRFTLDFGKGDRMKATNVEVIKELQITRKGNFDE
ncbi:MAG: cold shock domain-containing protein [Deltaproteobacteria bacterium]|nr:cold shock domain-containing protein [Deltaproteobacteria bacterium]